MKRSVASRALAASLLAALSAGATPALGNGVTVSESGQAIYSLPIVVPPGVAGMEPKLSLVYTSGGINGPVGVGWAVQGISQITRCAKAERGGDGKPVVRGVRYEVDDSLCLDGQRLVRVTTTGGLQGSAASDQSNLARGLTSGNDEFRTETDNYSRIRSAGSVVGNTAFGPSTFFVESKAGVRSEYGLVGSSTDGLVRVEGGQRAGVASAWLLKRVTDTANNYIEFTYQNDTPVWGTGPGGTATAGREWNLVKVTYGCNTAISCSKNHELRLVYGDRNDKAEAYHLGAKTVNTRLLNRVEAWAGAATDGTGGQLARVYRLTHEASPQTGRSVLKSVSECSDTASTNCLPATKFGYTSTTGRYVAATSFNLGNTALSTWDARHGVVAGDFNGDGKSDILRWDSRAGQNLTLVDQHNNPSQKRYVNHVWLANDKVPGKFDAAVNFSAPANTTTAADGTTSASLTQLGGPLSSSTGQYWEGIDTFAVDINGDGRTDLVSVCKTANSACPINRTRMWLSLTSSTDPTAADFGAFHELAIPPQGPKEVAADGTDTGRWVTGPLHTSSTQRSGECRPGAAGSGAGTWSDMELTDVFWQDMNSDGLVDIVSISYRSYSRSVSYQTGGPCIAGMGDYPSTTATLRYFQGRGDGTFVLKQSAPFTGGQRVFNEKAKSGLSHVEVMDVDGDGRPDIVFRRTRWVQDRNGNFQQQMVAVDPSPQHGDYRMLALDANGDGRMDIITVDPDATVPSPQNAGVQVSANPYAAHLFVNRGDGTFIRDDRPIAEINKLGDQWTGRPGTIAGQMKYGSDKNGSIAMDFNGDGMTDFLPWVGDHVPTTSEPETPHAFRMFLSKGGTDAGKTNGGFPGVSTTDVPHGLPGDLVTSGNSFSGGDFLGLGSAGFLKTGNAGGNSLWYRWGAPSDLLETVRTPLGQVTSVMYSSTGVATIGINGENNTPVTPAVYRNTRPVIPRPGQTTALERTQVPVTPYPIQHAHPASWVVSRTMQDSGVNGVAGVTTAFLYRGTKLDMSSGANLGFEAVSKYFPYANGGMLVTTSEYLQHPDQPQYQGLTRCTYTEYDPNWVPNSVIEPIDREFDRNRRSAIPLSSDTTRAKAMSVSSEAPTSTPTCFDRDQNLSTGTARVISMTSYVYGDVQTQHMVGAVDRPVEVATLVKRPFQYQSTQRTWDLKNPSLLVSKITTRNTQLTAYGDIEKSEVSTVGLGLPGGLGDTEYKKVTESVYELGSPFITATKWHVGRLKSSKATASTTSVAPPTPNSGLLTSQQLATRDPALGSAPTKPLSPELLSAILQLLLDE